jgi:hypothetical protein
VAQVGHRRAVSGPRPTRWRQRKRVFQSFQPLNSLRIRTGKRAVRACSSSLIRISTVAFGDCGFSMQSLPLVTRSERKWSSQPRALEKGRHARLGHFWPWSDCNRPGSHGGDTSPAAPRAKKVRASWLWSRARSNRRSSTTSSLRMDCIALTNAEVCRPSFADREVGRNGRKRHTAAQVVHR